MPPGLRAASPSFRARTDRDVPETFEAARGRLFRPPEGAERPRPAKRLTPKDPSPTATECARSILGIFLVVAGLLLTGLVKIPT